MGDLLVTNIGQLVTNDPERADLLGVVGGAAIACVDGVISWVGSEEDLPAEASSLEVLDAGGGAVIPGFVDPHTHLVFAGDRAAEFAMRLRGASYKDILAAGGGIHSTVGATRAASAAALFDESAERARRMLSQGTTTVEIKSGYGLEIESEVKMLEVAARIGVELPIDVVTTFLGGHVVPLSHRERRADYVAEVSGPMLEAAATLADFCDVFCDDAAFTVDETRTIAVAARSSGLGLRFHTEQLSHNGGAALAAEMGAASADHLDHATDADLAQLREAGTVAVLLPAVSFSMHLPYPDGRRIWDSGVTVAVATDCNPGTSYVEAMPFVVALASLEMNLTPEEALWAATRGAALSLGLADRGVITKGSLADLVMLDAPSYTHLAYRPGGPIVSGVVKRGSVVA